MQDFTNTIADPSAERYHADLDQALLCRALVEAGQPGTDTRRSIWSAYLFGTFNASAYGLKGIAGGYGLLEWLPDRDGYHLIWHSPTGLTCPLARLYPQPNGTWAAMVVAGVRDGLSDAMAVAEWAVSRLSG